MKKILGWAIIAFIFLFIAAGMIAAKGWKPFLLAMALVIVICLLVYMGISLITSNDERGAK